MGSGWKHLLVRIYDCLKGEVFFNEDVKQKNRLEDTRIHRIFFTTGTVDGKKVGPTVGARRVVERSRPRQRLENRGGLLTPTV